MPGNTPRPSGAWIRPSVTRWCALILVMSLPSNHTDPDVSGRRPEIARMMVVLPAPLAPEQRHQLALVAPPAKPRAAPRSGRSARRCRGPPAGSAVVSVRSVVIGHPQVGGDDLRVLADLGGQPVGDLAAELEHHDPVGDAHHQPHVVLDQQHRVAVVADLADQVHQRGLLARVEPGGRLVEAQQLGLGGQRAGDLQPPLVAVGQVLGLLLAAVARCRRTAAARRRVSIADLLLAAVPRRAERAHRAPTSGAGRRCRP